MQNNAFSSPAVGEAAWAELVRLAGGGGPQYKKPILRTARGVHSFMRASRGWLPRDRALVPPDDWPRTPTKTTALLTFADKTVRRAGGPSPRRR
jgi:hypothetical protein